MALTETATVTSKGQVTIPKAIRDRLGLDEGTEVEFVVDEAGELAVRPTEPPMERLRDLRQTLSTHDVDLEAMRRESNAAWGSHGSREEPT